MTMLAQVPPSEEQYLRVVDQGEMGPMVMTDNFGRTDYMIPELDPYGMDGAPLGALNPLAIFQGGTNIMLAAIAGGVIGGALGYYATRNSGTGWKIAGSAGGAVGGFYLFGVVSSLLFARRFAEEIVEEGLSPEPLAPVPAVPPL